MPATILLADHTGRLGNRLILYSHVLAAAEELGCRVVNLSILAASHYFQGLYRNPWGSYPPRALPWDFRWVTRPLRTPIQNWVRSRRGGAPIRNKWLTVLDMEHQPLYRLDSPEFAKLTRSTRWLILWGYRFRCPDLVRRHQEKVREFFRFRDINAPNASAWLAAAKARGKKTVCIHVRLDDVVNEACRYVEPRLYASALGTFLKTYSKEEWEVFVCSDGQVPENLFPPETLRGIPRSLAEDFALMSGCDMVIGFDSTVSIFAAFLSGKPFLRINRENGALAEKSDLFYSL